VFLRNRPGGLSNLYTVNANSSGLVVVTLGDSHLGVYGPDWGPHPLAKM
jgi:hypothetical protein